jgi:hypothetical protein
LQCGLMMPGLAGRRAITIGPQTDHRALHDGLVGGVETVVCT